jgi:hypothetical protein
MLQNSVTCRKRAAVLPVLNALKNENGIKPGMNDGVSYAQSNENGFNMLARQAAQHASGRGLQGTDRTWPKRKLTDTPFGAQQWRVHGEHIPHQPFANNYNPRCPWLRWYC